MPVQDEDILRVSVVWKVNDADEQVNVWHILCDGITGDMDAGIRLDIEDVMIFYYESLTDHIANVVKHDRIDFFNATQSMPMVGTGRTPSLDGVNGGQLLPLQVTATVWWRTNASRHIGRKFLPTFTEAANNAGIIDTTTVAGMSTFLGRTSAGVPGTEGRAYQMVIWDDSLGSGRVPIGGGVSTRFKTQRRRRVGVGR